MLGMAFARAPYSRRAPPLGLGRRVGYEGPSLQPSARRARGRVLARASQGRDGPDSGAGEPAPSEGGLEEGEDDKGVDWLFEKAKDVFEDMEAADEGSAVFVELGGGTEKPRMRSACAFQKPPRVLLATPTVPAAGRGPHAPAHLKVLPPRAARALGGNRPAQATKVIRKGQNLPRLSTHALAAPCPALVQRVQREYLCCIGSVARDALATRVCRGDADPAWRRPAERTYELSWLAPAVVAVRGETRPRARTCLCEPGADAPGYFSHSLTLRSQAPDSLTTLATRSRRCSSGWTQRPRSCCTPRRWASSARWQCSSPT